jgi:hypothetical protein
VYCIHKGTPGLLRQGRGPWRPHKATRDRTFAEADARPHRGGYVVFALAGYEFMLLEKHAREGYRPRERGKSPTGRHQQFSTFNKCILGHNGRGATRRRNVRRRRS